MLEINTSKYNTFLFDFDGTLVDTEQLHYDAYIGALKTIGVEYVSFEDHVRDNVGPPSEEVLRKELRKNGRTEVALDELVLMKKYIFTQNLMQNGVKAIDGAIEFLYSLKQKGVKLALVSGGKYEAINRVMVQAGIPNLFDIIITKEMVEKQKPDPESYQKALKMLDAKSESSIAFENDSIGIEAASKAGIFTVGVVKYDFDHKIKQKTPNIDIIASFKNIKAN
jgi:beta-phosphoglucomutase